VKAHHTATVDQRIQQKRGIGEAEENLRCSCEFGKIQQRQQPAASVTPARAKHRLHLRITEKRRELARPQLLRTAENSGPIEHVCGKLYAVTQIPYRSGAALETGAIHCGG